MKMNSLITTIIVLVLIVVLGYGVFLTTASSSEITTKVEEITPVTEKEPIDAGILSSKELQKVQGLRTYGQHPIIVDPKNLNRSDPFAGI